MNTVSFYNIWNLEVHGTPAWVIIMTDHIPVPEAGAKPPVFEYAVQLLLSAAILRIIFYKDYEICDIKKSP